MSAPARLTLLVISPGAVFPLELPAGQALVLGRGEGADVRVEDKKVARQHLRLTAAGERVELEELSQGGTRLNDVQLRGRASARAGDSISLGETVLLVQLHRAPRGKWPLAGPLELDRRWADEVARAVRFERGVALLLLKSPAREKGVELLEKSLATDQALATWGTLAGDVLGAVLAEVSTESFASMKDRLTGELGEAGVPFRLGWALCPDDGASAEGLLEFALRRLAGRETSSWEEPLFVDPVMVRLWAAIERLGRAHAPVLLVGPEGSGRHTLAQAIFHRSGMSGPLRVVRCLGVRKGELEEGLFTPQEGALFLDRIDALPEKLFQRLPGCPSRIFASTPLPLGEGKGEGRQLFSRSTLTLPPLANRPSDILPLAEHFLGQLRRRRWSLAPATRAALLAYDWPGNVRELRNAMERAALAAESDELRPEHLPPRVTEDAGPSGGENLRSALKAAEKEALLKALARTQWNVTAAARGLGLPRRTVVYRMARLGLRRPAR
ncbi:MAG: helix-turn-helix domain-containing protein [Myxococcota bacterium]